MLATFICNSHKQASSHVSVCQYKMRTECDPLKVTAKSMKLLFWNKVLREMCESHGACDRITCTGTNMGSVRKNTSAHIIPRDVGKDLNGDYQNI